MQSPVPALSHSLTALSKILEKAQAHSATSPDSVDLLNASLYPDMANLIRNVRMSCDTAKLATARLSQTQAPVDEDTETTFEDLQARIQRTLSFMSSVSDAAFDGAEGREIVMQAGPQEFRFPSGPAYLSSFAVPNFYFHVTTSYAILRHNGVEIGKRDYLGV